MSFPPQPVQKQVSFTVAAVSAAYENWQMHADYMLNGMRFANNSTLNYYTAAPVGVDQTGASTSHMNLYNSMHSVPGHVWYLAFQQIHDNTGLQNNNKTAWANYAATVSFPNQNPGNPPIRYCSNGQQWQAAIILH